MKVAVDTYTGITHAIAFCHECGWENQNRKNAMATGKIHAMTHGHKVDVEQLLSVRYKPSGRRD